MKDTSKLKPELTNNFQESTDYKRVSSLAAGNPLGGRPKETFMLNSVQEAMRDC